MLPQHLNAGVARYAWRSSSLRLSGSCRSSSLVHIFPYCLLDELHSSGVTCICLLRLRICRDAEALPAAAFALLTWPASRPWRRRLITGARVESAMRATKLTGGDPNERVETA